MAKRITYPLFKAFDSNGDPLSGGKVETYQVGSVVKERSYADYGRTANSYHKNPVILNARGEAKIFLGGHGPNIGVDPIKIITKDKDDVELWSADNKKYPAAAPPTAELDTFHAYDDEGNDLAGGKLYTYYAGTSQEYTTYSDVGLSVPNDNPVILDSEGKADLYCEDNYMPKLVLKDANDVLYWTGEFYATTIDVNLSGALAMAGISTPSQLKGFPGADFCWNSEGIQVEWGFGGSVETFSGNVLTVGVNGPCGSYDYATPWAAEAAASAGDLILIYPGTYSQSAKWVIEKNIILRGMGASPEDVIIQRSVGYLPTSQYPNNAVEFDITSMQVILENLWVRRDCSNNAGNEIGLKNCDADGIFYGNKLALIGAREWYPSGAWQGGVGGVMTENAYVGAGSPPSPDWTYPGDFYLTNVTIHNGSGHEFYGLGDGSAVSVLSASGMEYDTYNCSNCDRNPSPHDYNEMNLGRPAENSDFGQVDGYGYQYGDYLIKFAIQ